MDTHDVTETPRHSVSVAAAIFDESGENVLLIKRRDNGHWEPPGGVLELQETIEAGLKREVHEETGAAVEIGRLTGVYKNMSRGIVALVFRCRLKGVPLTATPEAAEIQWKSIKGLHEFMNPTYFVRIADACDQETTSVRSHDGTRLLEGEA